MSKLRRTLVGLVPYLGLLVFAFGLAWLVLSPRYLQSLPGNLSYQADIFSQDNLYDEDSERYEGKQNSSTSFYYQTVSRSGNNLQIQGVFDVKSESGEQIFKVDRLYGVDKSSGQHSVGGDRERDGYLFAPRNLKPNQNYTYWHINYDQPIQMQYQSTENILGLEVFRYTAKFQADQSSELSGLAGVPNERGVKLDVELTTWVEPTTGNLIKYQDAADAYYYDKASGEKLNPWNQFSNRYAVAAVNKHVAETRNQLNSEYFRTRVVGYIITLLGLAIIAERALRRRRLNHVLVVVIIIVGLGLTLVAFLVASTNLRNQTSSDYANRAQEVEQRIVNKLEVYENSLRGGVGLLAARENVTRQEWKAYVETLDIRSRLPGLQGIGWAKRLTSEAESRRLIDQVQNEGFDNFTIWPASQKPDRYPIIFLEPFDKRNRRAFGYNMYQEATRKRAMDQAIDSGRPSLSGRVTLVQENEADTQDGFLLYVPLYKPGTNPITTEERRANIVGFVYAPLRANDFINSALSEVGESLVFNLYDATDDNAQLLYASQGDKTNVYRESVITAFGSDWKVNYYTQPSDIYTLGSRNRWAALALGLTVSFLIAGVVYLQQRTGKRAQKLANEMTQDLQEREARAKQAALASKRAEKRLSESQQLLLEQNKALEDTKRATLNILEDLAEEKEKLQTETARTEAMINSIGEGLIVANAKGIIVEANPVAANLLGTTRENLLGKWYPSIVQLTDDKNETVEQTERPEVRALLSAMPVEVKDLNLVRSNGSLPVAITASPYILDAHPIGTVIALRDITKERELDQAKDDFLGLASHQLRTPATAVKQYIGLLLDGYTGKLTKEQMETLQAAHLSNERQIDVVQDMLSVARLESGRLELNTAEFDLVAMVKAAIEEQRLAIEKRKQSLSVELPAKQLIEGDEKLLRMVVENLVSNASKYTPEKGTVLVKLTKTGEQLRLDVKDSGVGISKQDQANLFKRFSRIKNELSEVVGGSGLGLYIAKKIIELHGGKISVSSSPQEGTTFTLSLNQRLTKPQN